MTERKQFRAIKGTRDILPPESALWNHVEQTAREVFSTFGFGEIRIPELELSRLFERAVGDDTDIVAKELFTWVDSPRANKGIREARVKAIGANYRGNDPVAPLREEMIRLIGEGNFDKLAEANRISLRPEGTASVCRAYIEHGMYTWPQPVKLYYIGPMFRRERPQKGRYRQFYQIGAEVLGQSDAPAIDAELLEMLLGYFDRVGLTRTTLYINSIGDKRCRPLYVELLRGELRKVKGNLKEDSRRRIETNPLRVLDSKIPEEQPIIEKLPRISDHLCDDCRAHFAKLKEELALRSVPYQENWRLVRGLDYYTRTTFEVTAEGLGSQNAVCGGGRYDGLVELLGGPTTKGIGFAIGTDRVVLALSSILDTLVPNEEIPTSPISTLMQRPDLVVTGTTEGTWSRATVLAQSLRRRGLSIFLPKPGTKLPKVFDAAQKLGIRVAIIVGENESQGNQYAVRVLQPTEPKSPRDLRIPFDDVVRYGKLVKLRQDLERSLARLSTGVEPTPRGIALSRITQTLIAEGILPNRVGGTIQDLMSILNSAIHGKELTSGSVDWALATGNLLLNELETINPFREKENA